MQPAETSLDEAAQVSPIDGVPTWLVDSDYDGRTFCICETACICETLRVAGCWRLL